MRDLNIDKDILISIALLWHNSNCNFLKKFHENEKCVFSVAPRSVAIGILAHVSNDKRWWLCVIFKLLCYYMTHIVQLVSILCKADVLVFINRSRWVWFSNLLPKLKRRHWLFACRKNNRIDRKSVIARLLLHCAKSKSLDFWLTVSRRPKRLWKDGHLSGVAQRPKSIEAWQKILL